MAVAIVGARNASAEACRFARGLAHDLGENELVVVSGLARGVDTAAHEGALESGTIAVIAGGIDVFYPPENEQRQRTLYERGLVLAEMPPGTEPRARHSAHAPCRPETELVNGHDNAVGVVEELLAPSPVPVDEVIRLSGASSGAVQITLLELDLAGRLDRHACNKVSLRAA